MASVWIEPLGGGSGADVMMFVTGRTGQLVLCALIIVWAVRRFGLRGLVGGVVSVAVLVTLSYTVSPVFPQRVAKTVQEMERAQVESVSPECSSVGVRLEWYQNAIKLIAAHPLVGVGTGSFPRAYAEMVTNPAAVNPAHPHHQYLLTRAELGVVGLLALPALFGMLWWRLRKAEGLFFAWIISAALAADCVGASRDTC